jgi:putative hydrolase of the HAD superfamily
MWLMLLDFKVADTALAHELSTAYLEILPTQTRLVPHAKELLDHCKDRYVMHLITNGFETTQRLKLQYSGISRYFSQVITSEKSNSIKPNKDIFDFALYRGKCNSRRKHHDRRCRGNRHPRGHQRRLGLRLLQSLQS